jgi:uncharacterized membrane protein YphA (DoxX/SURF4 family)
MKNYINWALRLVPAIILLQTLFFKFSAHPDSVAIFSKLHAEPFGRVFSGVLELITAILILNPKTTFWGALLGFFTMIGAIVSHIFILGIETNNDGGKLFYLALVVFVFCVILLLKFKNMKILKETNKFMKSYTRFLPSNKICYKKFHPKYILEKFYL